MGHWAKLLVEVEEVLTKLPRLFSWGRPVLLLVFQNLGKHSRDGIFHIQLGTAPFSKSLIGIFILITGNIFYTCEFTRKKLTISCSSYEYQDIFRSISGIFQEFSRENGRVYIEFRKNSKIKTI